jgi:hypothetical protein
VRYLITHPTCFSRSVGQDFVCISVLSRTCYMIPPSHPLRCHHPNNNWQIQIMRLLILQCSSYSRHFLPLKSKKSKYSPQHPVLKHPSYIFFPTVYSLSHPHKTLKIYSLVYFNLCVFSERRRDKILNWMVSIISRI